MKGLVLAVVFLLIFTVYCFANEMLIEAIEKFARENFGSEATIVSLQIKSSPSSFDKIQLTSHSRSKSFFSFLFKAYQEEKFCGYVRVECELAVFADVLVVNRTVRSNEVLGVNDVTLQRVNLLTLNVEHCTDLNQVVGKIARRMFRQNEPLDARYLAKPPDVRAGQLLTARVTIGPIVATAQVRAMRDGYIGERISVRNVSSGVLIEGLLQEDLTVLVTGG
ncbi:MAG: Flagella basal body P-ring formation protein FlgA [Thermotoga sp. 50_1627]|nr:MAG: Flagella basal body P-ring formation protein FlgA [Thermotoga sp. 50_64]KUK24088.1 MAG: Flagella basal body P-ring formation protein FlgA [Thermotoga sp. 50_1627]HBT38856.1 flagella basal body P-ring formation protein FlgA [Pseudothermotoga sp.]HCO98552.1 flagella basal body P-ring formation protein FlgA [Pseudothermotoga sp.]